MMVRCFFIAFGHVIRARGFLDQLLHWACPVHRDTDREHTKHMSGAELWPDVEMQLKHINALLAFLLPQVKQNETDHASALLCSAQSVSCVITSGTSTYPVTIHLSQR